MIKHPLIESYVNECAVTRWRPTTVRLRAWQLQTFWVFLQQTGTALETCKRSHFVAFLAGYPEPQQRRSFFFAIRGLFQSLILDGLLPITDPTARLSPAALERGLPRPIPNDVFWRRYELGDARDKAMLTLGRFAGLRASEIAAANSNWLISDNLHVPGKGGSFDPVPAHPRIVDLFRRHSGHLFPSTSGRTRLGHVRADTISSLGSQALGKGWTMHTLRHAFITEVYENSGDLGVAQTAARHKSPITTRIYARLADSRLRGVVCEIDAGLPHVA